MRVMGLLLVSALALAACNALTGASDLGVCSTCGDDDAAFAPETRPDVSVVADASPDSAAPVDASSEDAVVAQPDAALGCNGGADCERVIFVSSTTFPGDLGGVAGADAKCQALANASSNSRVKGRAFLAWLSTAATSPSARLVHGTKRYVRVDSATIALDWNDLVSGGLHSGISLDENGMARDGQAWTGTRSEGGVLSTSTCSDWTAASFIVKGMAGNVGGNGGGWSSGSEQTCTTAERLYCVEK